MRRHPALLLLFFIILAPGLNAQQHAVDPGNRYHRLICVVPMIGKGTPEDPIRPEYAPIQPGADRDGIVAWSVQLTDNRKMAIVHFAAANRAAFAPILADKRPDVLVFDPELKSGAEIEKALRQLKAGFSLHGLKVAVQ